MKAEVLTKLIQNWDEYRALQLHQSGTDDVGAGSGSFGLLR